MSCKISGTTAYQPPLPDPAEMGVLCIGYDILNVI